MAQQATFTITAVDATRQAFESVKHNLEGMRKSFETLKSIATFGFLGHEVQEFARAVVEAGTKFERSQNLLAATLKATGYQAGITSTQVNELADTLSHSTRFNDEDLRTGMATLIRFGSATKETLDSVAKATADLAAIQGGDFATAAQTMGRALQGSERDLRALREVLPRLSERTIFQITKFGELGDKAEVTRRVLQAVQGQIAGMAEGENKGFVQATADLAKAGEELKKAWASLFGPAIVDAMRLVSDELRRWSELLRDIERVAGKIKIPDWLKDGLSRGTPFGQIPAEALKPKVGAKTAEEIASEKAEERKAEEGRKQRVQDNFLNEQRAAKERIELVKSQNDEIEKAQTQSAKEIESALKDYYDRGLIDAGSYYKALEGLQSNAIDVQVANAKKLITAQRASLATTLPNAQGPIKASISREEGEIRNRRQEQAGLALATDRKLRDVTEQLIDGRNELDAKIADQEGRLEEAGRIRLGLELRRQQEALAQLSGPQAAARSKELLTYAQNAKGAIAYNTAVRDTTLAQQEFANKERDIQSLVAAGTITEQEGLTRLDAARKESVASLNAYADAQERAAIDSKNPEAIQAVRNLRSEIRALESTADESTKAMRIMLEDSLNGPLIDFVNHTKSAKDAFLDFAKNVEQALLRMAVQNVSQGLFGGASGGGAGAGVGAIAPYLAGLFGGGGGAAAASGSSLAAAQAGTTAAQYAAYFAADGGVMTPHGMIELKRYARGGIASRPQLALFGEGRQNEAYVPLPDGRRIPVAMKGGGGNVQHLTVNIATPDAASFKRSESQVITSIAMAGRRAMARR